jgi:hypothetical protein
LIIIAEMDSSRENNTMGAGCRGLGKNIGLDSIRRLQCGSGFEA